MKMHCLKIQKSLVFLLLISQFAFVTAQERPVDLVRPLVDAANSRWFFFNSATRPFGMVNLSPDMKIDGAWQSGYRYNLDSIRSISHIHAWQLSGIPVLPVSGEFKGHLGPDVYRSSFSHEREEVRPGYHQFFLDDYDINVELTSTTRVGFHRYTFPGDETCHILLDLTTPLGPSTTERGYFKKVSDSEIEGWALMGPTRRRPKATYVYYVIQIDQPADQISAWKDGSILGETESLKGPGIGAYFSFDRLSDPVVQMKVGISYTSVQNARNNLESEVPGWEFDAVRADADETWNEWLSRIEVEGGTDTMRMRFYTDLWHALQGRRIISDVNGAYCDMTGSSPRIGQIPLNDQGKPRFNHYNSDSFWGAQWTLNTLWHLVYPRVSEEFVNSMLLMYRDGGLIPRGPSGGNYTYVMTGASSTPFVVSAYQKGIRGFDIDLAYRGLYENHMPGGIMSKAGYEHTTYLGGGLEYYLKLGYVPYPLPKSGRAIHEDGGGQTLEYAYQDWTLSRLAESLGKENDAYYFGERAKNYQNLWNKDERLIWIRNESGAWAKPIDRLRYGHGWVEGNAAQFNWWVPHDIQGLSDLMGGYEPFIQRLNQAFVSAEKHDFTSGKSHSVETVEEYRRIEINYGNQPSMQTAFLFNYVGAPWLTQYWSRRVVQEVYSGVSPQYGYSGDEDQGLMGSLAVLMKIGLFSVKGGCDVRPVYEIGSPIFDKVSIHLDTDYYAGSNFTIEAANNGAERFYIRSASLDDQTWDKSWIYHEDLVKGGKLHLMMDSKPNKDWASDPAGLPPSMSSN